uniref:Uncharacterized protein n=1 Tax=Romanomermis culicivorax TaxID=13658 RepID=A0A915L6H7_ROMCU
MMQKPWPKTETNGHHLLPDMLHSMGGSKSKMKKTSLSVKQISFLVRAKNLSSGLEYAFNSRGEARK